MVCCIIKRAVLPEGLVERCKRASEKNTHTKRGALQDEPTSMTTAGAGLHVIKEQMHQ